MRMPSAKQRRLLERATQTYQGNLSSANTYLRSRGIDPMTAELWRLGVVVSPEPGHEMFLGRLTIPYTNKLGVIGLKFRCMVGHNCKAEGCPKYLGLPGQEMYLFNVTAVEDDADNIHITEGELDAIVLSSVLGQPVVGLAGASAWKPHYPWHFRGFEAVYVWADGDKAGSDLAGKVRKEVPNAEIVQMPAGHDVSSVNLELGAEGVRKLAGMDGEDAILEAVNG